LSPTFIIGHRGVGRDRLDPILSDSIPLPSLGYSHRMHRTWTSLGAAIGLFAVAAGAFGAHALGERLDPDLLAVWDTASRYAALHALALLAVGAAAERRPDSRPLRLSGGAFGLGVLLFSGSLWVLALSGQRWLGAVTPLGGVSFMVGWLALLLAARRSASASG
jgi:uncharacterized membrane protein YgdD (TMEM256/DUF423 family)